MQQQLLPAPAAPPVVLWALADHPMWSGQYCKPFARRRRLLGMHLIKYDFNHKRAARTDGNVLTIAQIINGNLEAVAARAWVMVDLESIVKGQILDLDFVVDGHDGCILECSSTAWLNYDLEKCLKSFLSVYVTPA